ncbi:FAD/NAD(P)-binding domain-containing protein [Annulohypoxylon truncatum]|uniref:FAD/NAD(P)-binding domain-containing protein n=1 Tax=Annulohypoxylon truncatum TaxID=327061 RepID=UPI0020085E7E|nr:FAD/NAD(P)-binding domain-containing protein [Annulohypoxylon truncatum]KAI1205131.1 FAD/NAD(P)-binding domain-containing protein [Annulohypoxylon truncatum]
MPSRTEEANLASPLDGQYGSEQPLMEAQASNANRPVQGEDSLSVAIVGGGIVGIILALGLIDRGVRVAVYERASDFNEIGAGIAFTGVTRECMTKLSSSVIASLKRVANENQLAYDNYWDGYHNDVTNSDDETPERTLLFQLPNAKMAWWSCLRSHFLDNLARALPSDIVRFGKELMSYEDSDSDTPAPVTLRFADGTTETCDVLVGCDGIRSRVRQQLFANTHPQACQPRYTHKTCYRAVIPMAAAESALGESKAHNHCMHTGPGAHVLSYPIARHTLLNVVIFLSDSDSDSDFKSADQDNPHIRARSRDDILARLASWRPEVRTLITQIPETPLVWRIDDTAEHPAPWYALGRVCLAGDAAHASSPHHGAGAGFGVEDALALATALGLVMEETPIPTRAGKRQEAIAAALAAYNDVRYARTQWLVRSSRETGDIYEWMYAGSGSDPAKMRAEIAARQKVIWDFDVAEMVEQTRWRYRARIGGEGGGPAY